MTVPWQRIPSFCGGNVGSGCWRMETHEKNAHGNVMLLFLVGGEPALEMEDFLRIRTPATPGMCI